MNEKMQWASLALAVLAVSSLDGCAVEAERESDPAASVQVESSNVEPKSDMCGSSTVGTSFRSNRCNNYQCSTVQWTCSRTLTLSGWEYFWDQQIVETFWINNLME